MAKRRNLMNWNKTNKWQGFENNPQNAKKGWRPMSFKKQFAEFLNHDWTIEIEAKNIVGIDDEWNVKIRFPKKEMLVMKAVKWAMSNKWTESVKMIQWIVEMFDWKAVQPTENKNIDIEVSDKEKKKMNKFMKDNF